MMRADKRTIVLAAAVGAVATIVGAFLPWASVTVPFFGTVSVNGIDGDGKITFLAGLLIGAMAFALHSTNIRDRTGYAVILIAGITATGTAAYDWNNVQDVINETNDEEIAVLARVGSGLYVTVIGGFISAGAGLAGLLQPPPPIAHDATTTSESEL